MSPVNVNFLYTCDLCREKIHKNNALTFTDELLDDQFKIKAAEPKPNTINADIMVVCLACAETIGKAKRARKSNE